MRKYIIFLRLLLIVWVLSCKTELKKENHQKKSITTALRIDTNKTDTIFNASELILSVEYVGQSRYKATWSNRYFKNQDTLKILENGNLSIQSSKEKGIYLQQGCGTSCFFGYVLPFKPKAIAKYYMYPFAVDLENDMIAYNGEDEKHLMIVENYLTGKKQFIKADFLPGPYPGHSIDSVVFQNNNRLFIQWKLENGKVEKKLFELKE